ncbi:MAG: aldehyde dehydrogenase [Syntrophobacteraceae bacterium]
MDDRVLERHACWIHGQWRTGEKHYALVRPATGAPYAEATCADAEMVNLALRSGRDAFFGWRKTSAMERAGILHGWADEIRRSEDILVPLLSEEVGKPLWAARDEIRSVAILIDYFAEESLRMSGEAQPARRPRQQVTVTRVPVGVVVAITPFNYPLSTLACKVPAALAVGCSVVLKPDEHTPLSSLFVSRLAVKAGLPPGVFNVVTGPGEETGRLLVEHPIPRLVSFTGSTSVGKEVQALSARWVRKVILELGSNCPAIVCGDAAWREFLPDIVKQSFKNSGQYCYRISRLFVQDSIYEEFLTELRKLAEAIRVGPPSEPDTQLGPLNNAEMLSIVERQVKEAVDFGARIETGGCRLEALGTGYYFAPTILSGVERGAAVMHEEVFGPVVLVKRFSDVENVIREANATPYGLAAYLFTCDLGAALEWSDRLEAGSVWINSIHQAYPETPFGGMKQSGLGREKSKAGLEEYTELKALYVSY